MLRSVHPGIYLGALAVVAFGAGVAIEPLFETSAHATIPARNAKLLKPLPSPAKTLSPSVKAAPQPLPAAPAAASIVPAAEAPAIPETESAAKEPPAPSMEEGMDTEKNVEFIEMKDQAERQGEGRGDPGRDVDMIENSEAEDVSATAVPVPDPTPSGNDPEAATQN